MNRRAFLLTLSAASAIFACRSRAAVATLRQAVGIDPREARSIPTLYGDGVHDDTDAIQALIDAKAPIPSGTYRIFTTMRLFA